MSEVKRYYATEVPVLWNDKGVGKVQMVVLASDFDACKRERDKARGDLLCIDELLARRPALVECSTRYDKIVLALSTAKRAEKAEAERDELRSKLAASSLANAQLREALVDAAGAVKWGALQAGNRRVVQDGIEMFCATLSRIAPALALPVNGPAVEEVSGE